jgi:hypothetical protein
VYDNLSKHVVNNISFREKAKFRVSFVAAFFAMAQDSALFHLEHFPCDPVNGTYLFSNYQYRTLGKSNPDSIPGMPDDLTSPFQSDTFLLGSV